MPRPPTWQVRDEAIAARIAAEGRAKRAIKAAEYDILVRNANDRDAVRTRLMSNLATSQQMTETSKTEQVRFEPFWANAPQRHAAAGHDRLSRPQPPRETGRDRCSAGWPQTSPSHCGGSKRGR